MKKFKFSFDTRSSDQVSSEYKDHVDKFLNTDACPISGRLMKRQNLQLYRVKWIKNCVFHSFRLLHIAKWNVGIAEEVRKL